MQLNNDYHSNGTCSHNSSKAVAGIEKVFLSDGIKTLSKNDIRKLLKFGPVFTFVDASSFIFEQYKEGIIDTTDCGTKLNHAVIIVGYGRDEETGIDYFVI